MRPWSGFLPKELLPLGTSTCLEITLLELKAAGAQEFIIVYSPAKRIIVDYINYIACSQRAGLGNWERDRFHCVSQPTPRGSAHAIRCAFKARGLSRALVAYPDQVGCTPATLKQMADLVDGSDASAVQLVRITAANSRYFSPTGEVLEFEESNEKCVSLRNVRGASKGEQFHSLPSSKIFGRMLLNHDFCNEYDLQEEEQKGEQVQQIDDICVLQRLASSRQLNGLLSSDEMLNLGNWDSYCSSLQTYQERIFPNLFY